MKKKNLPTILITNDDGIRAPGIKHLWNAVKKMANIVIIAPSNEQSCVSLSLTIRHPLLIEKFDWPENTPTWSVNGTPADCIKLALNVILDNPPDLVISGINQGSNAGRNVLYSGTVAGVIEGIMHDVPGIAFSCYDYYDPSPNFSIVEKYIPLVINHVLEQPLPLGTFLNVNFPSINAPEIQGFKMTTQGKELWMEDPEERSHPSSKISYYWLGAKLLQCEEAEDSDIMWLRKGYITAVPIQVSDLTDHAQVLERRHEFNKLALS